MSTEENFSHKSHVRRTRYDKNFNSSKTNSNIYDNHRETKYHSRKNNKNNKEFSLEGRKFLRKERENDRYKEFPKNDDYKHLVLASHIQRSTKTKTNGFRDNKDKFEISNTKKKENLIKKKEKIEALKKRTKYELMYEAFHIANLFYLMNQSTYDGNRTFETQFYILSTKWFEKWKNYVNFDYYMQNTEKFLKLNGENQNPSINHENILEELDKPVKIALENYFENYFLTDNSRLYPGAVTNKELIYDKGLYYMDLNQKSNYLNYNVMEFFQMGRDYFIVTKQIWNYFKTIYGGKEIKRYIIDKSKIITEDKIVEYAIETKLKNILLCVVRFKKDEIKLKERPKFVFFPHKKTIYDFKKHLLKIFSFLKDSLMRDLRLWLLDPNKNFDSFEEYLVRNYNDNLQSKGKYGENINFPGICLDLFDSNTQIEEIDALISNRIVVLEYVDNLNFKNFSFRRQYWSDLPLNLRESFKADSVNESEDKFVKRRSEYCNQSLNCYINENISSNYDTIAVDQQTNSSINDLSLLFKIKKFYLIKYGLVNLDSNYENFLNDLDYDNVMKKIYFNDEFVYASNNDNLKDDIFNSILDEEFVKETNFLRENLHLILDKNEIMQKFSYAYTNSDRFLISANNKDNSSKVEFGDSKVKSRQEMIMKKREREKLICNSKIATQKSIKMNDKLEEDEENYNIQPNKEDSLKKEITIIIDENTSNIDENQNELTDKDEDSQIIIEEKCNYCDKSIEEESDTSTCEKCKKTKYCNASCKSKDLRFHSKTCN